MTDPKRQPDRSRARRDRQPARLGVAGLVVGLVLGLLPGVARAHYDVPGINDAQLEFTDEAINPFTAQIPPNTVRGRNFVANDRVVIFECPLGETDLLNECLVIGGALSDANGDFTSQVEVVSVFATPSGKQINCKGWLGSTQCVVAAATFDTTLQQRTSFADHYVCFEGSVPCTVNRDGSPTTTTTTTVPPAGAEWEPAAPMGTARQRHAAVAASNGHIYAIGGNEADGDGIASAEAFDSCKQTWSSIAPMPTPRTQFAAVGGPDGRIYVIGGRDRLFGPPVATVEAYDPVSNTWSAVSRLSVARSDLAAAVGYDGRIYAIGGTAPRPGSAVATDILAVPTVEAYDPATNQWDMAAPLTSPKSGHGAVTIGDRIYVIGGEVEYYGPGPAGTPGIWQRTAASRGFSSTAFTGTPDGLIYAIGGQSGTREALRTMTIYDPVADTWTNSTEALTARRSNVAAAPGLDGRIYAIGGTDSPDPMLGDPPIASTEALQVGPNNCPRLTQPADFDGDFDTDVSVFRPSAGTWFAKDGTTVAYGAEGDIPVPADYDGDQVTDVAVFRPSVGLWAIHRSSDDTSVFVTYGIGTDVPVPADYDGDAKADIAIYRPELATWWVRHSSTGLDVPTTFGIGTDVPVPADYDGDAKADLGLFRNGIWFSLPSSGGTSVTSTYGASGDIPVPADYDADRVIDRAVFRPADGSWSLHRSSDNTDETFTFGVSGDIPQPGDYNGDRISDPAVFRPSTGEWFIETGEDHLWGLASDIPLPRPHAVRRAYLGGTPS